MGKHIIIWLGVAVIVAAIVVSGIVWSNLPDTTPTWTYVLGDSGIVIYETQSQGYPEVVNDFTEAFQALNPDGSFSEVRTEFSTMTFPFRVQVFQDPATGNMKFSRSFSGDANYSAPESTPSPNISSTP